MSSSVSLRGQELIDGRAFLDVCEAKWLVTLAEFDSSGAFELDGHGSTVHWLVERCGMGRSTAAEKLRLSHELRRRPVVAAAFVDGRLTYSKARAFTRLVGVNDERDEALIGAYAAESADLIERMVRWWNLRNGDDDGPEPDAYDVPRIKFHPGFGGANGRIIIEGSNEDLSRMINVIDAYGTFLHFNARSANDAEPVDESSVKAEDAVPVDESSVKTTVLHADDASEPAESITAARGGSAYEATWEPAVVDDRPNEPLLSLNQRRYEWFQDLIEEIALVHDHQLDPDRASVAITVAYEALVSGRVSDVGVLDAGPIITGRRVRQLCCDAGISRMIFKGASEILDTGRKTRTWSKAQRRAIRHRHGNKCAVRGCDRRITEIHHLVFWDNGGLTCIENGIPLCSRHHHMVHDLGWIITWDPTTGHTTFTGPQGQTLQAEVDPFLVRPPAFAA